MDNEEYTEVKKSRRKAAGAFILGVIVALAAGILINLVHARSGSPDTPHSRESIQKIQAIEDVIADKYMGEVDNQKLTDYMMLGLVSGLEDPYSTYYTEKEYEMVQQNQNGVFKGIGATITLREEGYHEITDIIPGSPAEKVGLAAGDIILSVDGAPCAGLTLTEVVYSIRYSEDDVVTIVVKRGDEELSYDITKDYINDISVRYEMLDDNIGYLRLTAFNGNTPEQFADAMKDLLKVQKAERLIIDLRGNPGGLLSSVCDICNQVLPEGLICYAEDKKGNREEYYSDGENELMLPCVVLINGDSASAAEIFSGAVQDYGKAVLVGTTSFGKGIIQNAYKLYDGSVLKLTIAHYYTPNGRDIHGVGIEPDVTEEDPEKQLDAAIREVKKL